VKSERSYPRTKNEKKRFRSKKKKGGETSGRKRRTEKCVLDILSPKINSEKKSKGTTESRLGRPGNDIPPTGKKGETFNSKKLNTKERKKKKRAGYPRENDLSKKT